VPAHLRGLLLDLVEERRVGGPGADEVGLHPLHRVLQLPRLELAGEPVPGGVVGGGVRAHPVGVGLDQGRALAVARRLHRLPGDREAREHVVAVHLDAREAKPARPLVERYAALPFQRLGNGPLVVLAEEHDRGVENRRPDKRLVHISLARGAVAEVDNGGLAVLADQSVPLDTHCVAGGVQGLGADDDGVEVKVVVVTEASACCGVCTCSWPIHAHNSRAMKGR